MTDRISRVGRTILFAMLWPFGQIWRRICFVGRLIKLATLAVLHSPVGAYRAVIRGRDWLLAKIEYLQAESTNGAYPSPHLPEGPEHGGEDSKANVSIRDTQRP